MKKCIECGEVKPLNEFYKHKQMKDGHLNKCKECVKQNVRNNPKTNYKNDGSYDKTEKGVIMVMYKTQKANSKKRGHNPPQYTKEEFAKWLYKNGFKELYDKWVESGYDKNLKPSVDRIDDFKGYEFGNIILTIWEKNKQHQINDIYKGVGTSGKRCKKVLCFKNGNIVAEYVSFSEARRIVGYSFEKVLNTGRKDRKGYEWWYEDKHKKEIDGYTRAYKCSSTGREQRV